jgi:hypothetical protein
MSYRLPLALLCASLLACYDARSLGGDEEGAATDRSSTDSGGESPVVSGSGGEAEARVTYYRDAKAILDARCATCHRPGDVAPFSLATGEEAQMFAGLIAPAIESRTMPPWPPSASCNRYEHDRSLSASERELLLAWVEEGAALGDPAETPAGSEPPAPIAWDLELALPEPYTPTRAPDDYRCFVLDWPEGQLKYVTGFDVAPGERAIVHHAIAFLIPPSDVPFYKERDAAEAGPGYSCFGGSGGALTDQWLAAWAPGAQPAVDPSRGIAVAPGSAIVLQLHYHPMSAGGPADQTRLRLTLADSVEVPLYVVPFTNLGWLFGDAMLIPAGAPRTVHSVEADLSEFLAAYFPQAGVEPGAPFLIHEVSLHMHTRGRAGSLKVIRGGGEEACALDIADWDFGWQGGYRLRQPLRFGPGDMFRLTCEWDNSPANQPYEDGVQVAPKDLRWGEGTDDEMCLAILTVSAAP